VQCWILQWYLQQVRAYHQAKLHQKHRSQQSFCSRLRGSSDCRALLSTLQDRGVGVSFFARVANISLFFALRQLRHKNTETDVSFCHTDAYTQIHWHEHILGLHTHSCTFGYACITSECSFWLYTTPGRPLLRSNFATFAHGVTNLTPCGIRYDWRAEPILKHT